MSSNIEWRAVVIDEPFRAGKALYLYGYDESGALLTVSGKTVITRQEKGSFEEGVLLKDGGEPLISTSYHMDYNGIWGALKKCLNQEDFFTTDDKQVKAMKGHLEDMRKLVFKDKWEVIK